MPIALVAKKYAVWAMGIAHFCATYPLYFIIAWLPLYLVQSRGLTIKHMTYLATLGFVAQAISALLLGWGSDAWTRSGRSEEVQLQLGGGGPGAPGDDGEEGPMRGQT